MLNTWDLLPGMKSAEEVYIYRLRPGASRRNDHTNFPGMEHIQFKTRLFAVRSE